MGCVRGRGRGRRWGAVGGVVLVWDGGGGEEERGKEVGGGGRVGLRRRGGRLGRRGCVRFAWLTRGGEVGGGGD